MKLPIAVIGIERRCRATTLRYLELPAVHDDATVKWKLPTVPAGRCQAATLRYPKSPSVHDDAKQQLY